MPQFAEIVSRLRLPAVLAPMTDVSTPALVADACAAGIVGAFPTSNARSSAELEEWFDEIAERTSGTDGRVGGAMCANLILARQNRRLDGDIECVARRRPDLVITSVGSPATVIGPLHAAGCVVLSDVASEHHARRALEAGADGLVLLSAGAGGHTGWANPFAFVRAVRRFYDGPLAVAGGMSDGHALWGAQCAGYDLGLFGTRFMAAAPSGSPPSWRSALVEARLDDVVLGAAANGLPASMLRSGICSAGHTVDAVRATESVADIVDELERSWLAARETTEARLTRRMSRS